eukprot:SAG11_NODE_2326_length_3518_cov_401.419713_4_plen_55_part_00
MFLGNDVGANVTPPADPYNFGCSRPNIHFSPEGTIKDFFDRGRDISRVNLVVEY